LKNTKKNCDKHRPLTQGNSGRGGENGVNTGRDKFVPNFSQGGEEENERKGFERGEHRQKLRAWGGGKKKGM